MSNKHVMYTKTDHYRPCYNTSYIAMKYACKHWKHNSLHTLKIYRDSGFTSLSTAVWCVVVCRYSKIVGLTQMCCAVQACRYCHIVSSAVQIIGSNVEISTINHLSSFTPLHRKTCTNIKPDICNTRGRWRGWRETNEERVNLPVQLWCCWQYLKQNKGSGVLAGAARFFLYNFKIYNTLAWNFCLFSCQDKSGFLN